MVLGDDVLPLRLEVGAMAAQIPCQYFRLLDMKLRSTDSDNVGCPCLRVLVRALLLHISGNFHVFLLFLSCLPVCVYIGLWPDIGRCK